MQVSKIRISGAKKKKKKTKPFRFLNCPFVCCIHLQLNCQDMHYTQVMHVLTEINSRTAATQVAGNRCVAAVRTHI